MDNKHQKDVSSSGVSAYKQTLSIETGFTFNHYVLGSIYPKNLSDDDKVGFLINKLAVIYLQCTR